MGKRKSLYREPFAGFPRSVLTSAEFRALSPAGCKLLLDVASQFNGHNNGDLSAAWALMRERGWSSKTTLANAKRETIDAGFLYRTRQGKLPNRCELLALTWFPLDVSPKFDPNALESFTGWYKRRNVVIQLPKSGLSKKFPSPDSGHIASA